jgi:hypothetical protein
MEAGEWRERRRRVSNHEGVVASRASAADERFLALRDGPSGLLRMRKLGLFSISDRPTKPSW